MTTQQTDISVTTTKEINEKAMIELQEFLVALDMKYQLRSLIITPRPPRVG
jgi:hypothetical protein